MSSTRTPVLAAMLAALAIEFALFERDEEERRASRPPALLECGGAAPDRLTISSEGRTVEATRRDGAWTAPGGPLAPAALASLADALCRLPVLDAVPSSEPLAEFGLSTPRATITGTVAGAHFALAIGRSTPAANQVYARREPGRTVLIVGAELASGVEHALAATGPTASRVSP